MKMILKLGDSPEAQNGHHGIDLHGASVARCVHAVTRPHMLGDPLSIPLNLPDRVTKLWYTPTT